MSDQDKLRKKHKVGRHIPILNQLPAPAEVSSQKSFLVRIGEAFGLQEWMWKSWTGKVLALIVVPPAFCAAYDWWKPKIEVGYNHIYPYVRSLSDYDVHTSSSLIGFVDPSSKKIINHSQDIIAYAPAIEPEIADISRSTAFFVNIKIWRGISATRLQDVASLFQPSIHRRETRWLPTNSSAFYAALDPILAVSESTPAFGDKRQFSIPYVLIRGSLTGLAKTVERSTLPSDWNSRQEVTRAIGARWIQEFESGILFVPSTIDPSNYNVVVNVRHPSVSVFIDEVERG